MGRIVESLVEKAETGNWRRKTTVSYILDRGVLDKICVEKLKETGKFPEDQYHIRTVPNFQGGSTLLITRNKL